MSAVVRYHGSQTAAHGLYTLYGWCCCDECAADFDQWEANDVELGAPSPLRWVLYPLDPAAASTLTHVQPQSFTPLTQP